MSYYCHSTVPLSTICDEYYHIDKDTVDNLIFLHTILPDVWSFTYMKTFTNIIMDLTCQKTSLLWGWNSENWPWHGWHVWHELIPIHNLTMTCNNDEFIMTPRHSLSISWAWIPNTPKLENFHSTGMSFFSVAVFLPASYPSKYPQICNRLWSLKIEKAAQV